MSIMSLSRGNGNGNGKSKRVEPTPPRPVVAKKLDPEAAQFQLGNVTLEAVDRLTGMTADEIDRLAEQVLDGAEQTSADLRELARRVRENGMFANERLARFVRVANECADMARSMQQSVELRDEQSPPEPRKVEARATSELGVAEVEDAPALVAVEQEIGKEVEGIRNGIAP